MKEDASIQKDNRVNRLQWAHVTSKKTTAKKKKNSTANDHPSHSTLSAVLDVKHINTWVDVKEKKRAVSAMSGTRKPSANHCYPCKTVHTRMLQRPSSPFSLFCKRRIQAVMRDLMCEDRLHVCHIICGAKKKHTKLTSSVSRSKKKKNNVKVQMKLST
jgi:hypothetical protein